MKLRKGARVRIAATGEIGTVMDKEFHHLGGQALLYVQVQTDKHPGGIWMQKAKLADVTESCTVAITHENGTAVEIEAVWDHDEGKINMDIHRTDGGNLFDVPQLLKIFTRALGKGLKSEFDLVKVEANPAK